ncbi:hypothetical protein [Edaphobacter aggregans]|uniref:glucuronyl esterase domain-containing protein n=1 Tax=Edaphobacter aggregans TaxID=570835 RepID=UPI00055261E5|nr:hypothetical protein [Edaphobacter aggregans]
MRLRVGLWMAVGLMGIHGGFAQGPRPEAPASLPREVAGIPVNYDEGKVGTYTLPDPLVLNDGKPVKDAKTWTMRRRPEIVRILEAQQFGVEPGRPKGERFEVVEKGTEALRGKAVRRRVEIHLLANKTAPVIHLVEYLPAAVKRPVPMLLTISFTAPSSMVDDPGLPEGEIWDAKTKAKVPAKTGREFGKIDVAAFLDAGIGVATFYYGDVEPDYAEGFSQGVRRFYLKKRTRGPEEWGSIAAWAWGMSRVEDYFETDKSVDAKRVAIHGVSRLGKTVMWAGAQDERFAAVIASCSGEGGAALSHRDYGETIAHLTAPSRYPYQFAENFGKWAGFPDKAPMDAHMLVALIAPRPVLLQTGTTDFWSDPKGEFLAAVAAEPVYRLLGKEGLGLGPDGWPEAKTPVFHDIGYYMHDGGHGMVPGDWQVYVEFLTAHLHPER